jgi:hypothetical protein
VKGSPAKDAGNIYYYPIRKNKAKSPDKGSLIADKIDDIYNNRYGQVGQNKEEKRITSTEKDKANENI